MIRESASRDRSSARDGSPLGSSGDGRRRALLLAVAWTLAAPLGAGVCTVPGSHALIQDAVDDPACSAVELAAGAHAESVVVGRSVDVAGAAGGGTVIGGRLRVEGGATTVELRDLRLENGCPARGVEVRDGGAVVARGVGLLHDPALPCPPMGLFSDGFESGTTDAWS